MSFKPNTDDMREAPALVIIPRLIAAGASIAAYNPAARNEAAKLLSAVDWREDAYSVAQDADALVILTEWNEFRALDLDRIAAAMKSPLLIDLRNIYKPEEIAKTPFAYHSVGRAPVNVETVMPLSRRSRSPLSADQNV